MATPTTTPKATPLLLVVFIIFSILQGTIVLADNSCDKQVARISDLNLPGPWREKSIPNQDSFLVEVAQFAINTANNCSLNPIPIKYDMIKSCEYQDVRGGTSGTTYYHLIILGSHVRTLIDSQVTEVILEEFEAVVHSKPLEGFDLTLLYWKKIPQVSVNAPPPFGGFPSDFPYGNGSPLFDPDNQ